MRVSQKRLTAIEIWSVGRYAESNSLNQYALSAADIGDALKRSASALEAGNNTFEESIALVTAMNEITQSAETTGNTLKVLSLRLRGASAELETAGEDTDGLCESTSKLREQIKSLTGVDIMLNENTFKSTTEIIKELGAVWNNLTDVSQAATLEIIAGKTRANGVKALLKNYKQIDNVMADLEDSEGSALKENEAVVDSIEGRLKVLNATVEDLSRTLANTTMIKTFVSAGTGLLSLLNDLIKTFGGLSAALGVLGGIGIPQIFNLDYVIHNIRNYLQGSDRSYCYG